MVGLVCTFPQYATDLEPRSLDDDFSFLGHEGELLALNE